MNWVCWICGKSENRPEGLPEKWARDESWHFYCEQCRQLLFDQKVLDVLDTGVGRTAKEVAAKIEETPAVVSRRLVHMRRLGFVDNFAETSITRRKKASAWILC